MTLQEKITLVKKMIKLVGKECGKDKCKGYHPACSNCESQLLVGHLWNYLDTLEWEKAN